MATRSRAAVRDLSVVFTRKKGVRASLVISRLGGAAGRDGDHPGGGNRDLGLFASGPGPSGAARTPPGGCVFPDAAVAQDGTAPPRMGRCPSQTSQVH